jgi:hypothetical protein
MTEELQAPVLEAELALGRRAEQAYNLYVRAHIERTVLNVYSEIENCSVADLETLQKLKGLLTAIRGLESSILSDIDTGKMAAIALEKENE